MHTMRYVRAKVDRDWAKNLQRELDPSDGIPAVIKRRGALSCWEQLRSAPSGRAEDELSYALQIAPAEYEHPLVETCLKRSLQIIHAGAQDERWHTWWSVARDTDHGRFWSTGEFARAWLDDSDLNTTVLISASTEILRGAIEERPVWTELAQCEYIDGVQLLIIAGEPSEAAVKLKIRKRFNRVQRYYDWNVELLNLLNSNLDDREQLSNHLDPYFDEIRNPAFHVRPTEKDGDIVFGIPLLRLRLALIRWIYIERQPVAGNWRHIIGQIGY